MNLSVSEFIDQQDVAPNVRQYLKLFRPPEQGSHKGQNGKVLIIGGSELFHAASKWSLDVAAQFVDMVFYASVPSTNKLVQEAKGEFWNGIVIPRTAIDSYIQEADSILIGPGMERQQFMSSRTKEEYEEELSPESWNNDTDLVVHHLLLKYPEKQWVLDAGALQMVRTEFLPAHAILTPHKGEFSRLLAQVGQEETEKLLASDSKLQSLSTTLHSAVLLIKGIEDVVVSGQQVERVRGGNAGMTKGGTGDVLAGLVAALVSTQEPMVAAVVASATNKLAGDYLYQTKGPFFGASELSAVLAEVLWGLITS